MTRDEFIKACRESGYCDKKQAEDYANGKDEFTDDDFVEVFRINEKAEYLKRYDKRLGLKVLAEERCVCCGEVIPEGRQTCPICEKGAGYEGN